MHTQPDTSWLDSCLLSTLGSSPATPRPPPPPMPPHPNTSRQTSQAAPPSPSHMPHPAPGTSHFLPDLVTPMSHSAHGNDVRDLLQLVDVLVAVEFQPGHGVGQRLLQRWQQHMAAGEVAAQQLGTLLRHLTQLQVLAGWQWCGEALRAVLEGMEGGDPAWGAAACTLLACLPPLLLGPQALQASPLSPAPHSSSRVPLLLHTPKTNSDSGWDSNPDPPAAGPTGEQQGDVKLRVVKGWVAEHLPGLEQVTQGLGQHLHSATAQELLDIMMGCAQLRYYPGNTFMQWHQAACLRQQHAFKASQLVQVSKIAAGLTVVKLRGAYTSLGVSPATPLVRVMEVAQIKLERATRAREYIISFAAAMAAREAAAALGPGSAPPAATASATEAGAAST
ncbi:hypothetical protein QJQ45_016605 [Haematococcus lacustris]|nr:hypothetical protein QJQ45_016605 [Haematococcus lacustris]